MKKVLTLLLACLLNGILLANHYEPCYQGLYSQTNTNILIAYIDGVEQQSTSLEVGIFCGDECRGSAMAAFFEPLGRYTFYLNAYGENGHSMYFKLYDHNTGIEYEQDPSMEPVIYTEDGVGLLMTPYPVYFITPTIQQFTITAVADPEEGGTVEGTGTFDENTPCTLTANANEGWAFTKWTEDNEMVSSDIQYTFTVTEDRDLVANFLPLHYTPCDPGLYSQTTTIVGLIFIDDEEQFSDQLEVGVFSGEECRGTAVTRYFAPTGHYILYVNVYGENDHPLTFKLYDHSNDLEYESTNESIPFTEDGYGLLFTPYEIYFSSEAEAFYFVNEGNWSDASNWSGNALPGTRDEAIIQANCLLDVNARVAQMTIENGVTLTLQKESVLTVTGTLTNTEVEGLVIKDGAQLLNTPTPVMTEASIDFSQQGYTNGQDLGGVVIPIDNNVSIVFNKASGSSSPKYYSQGTAIRAYAKNNIVVSSPGTITSIVLTYGSGDGSNTITPNVGTFTSNMWTGSSSVVTFTIGGSNGHRRIKTVAVTYEIMGEVMATVEKDIIGYEGESGWYTIASPMNEMEIEESDFLTPEFDLYRYNEGHLGEEWENYKDESNDDFTLFENGRGYLYANSNTFTPTFVGALNGVEVHTWLMFSERPDELIGFNLVGNPFPHVIYKGNGGAIDDENLASGFYTLTNEGAWHVCTYQDAILPGQGILIKATDEMELTINKTNARANGESVNAKAAMPSLNLKVTGNAGSDRAVAYFGQGISLNKIDNPTEGAPMLYIHNDEGNFAIAHLNQEAETMTLMFQNTRPSTFTLTATPGDTNFSYLHLIDHITGTETDLLQQPDYTFQATGNEYAARFTLVFKVETGIEEQEQESFCFAKDGMLYFTTETGNATVTLIDVLGRIVKQADLSSTRVSISDLTEGVYIVRMNDGNEVKVQKIIIK